MKWRKNDREWSLEQELRSHLEAEEKDLREKGYSPAEARYAAQKTLGNTERIKEEVREGQGGAAVRNILQDVRYGIRSLFRTPGFAAAAIVTLALGIGGNTAVFSVVNTVLLKPLPYRDAGRLIRIWETHPTMHNIQASYPDFQNWRKETRAFEDMAAYTFEGWRKFNLLTARGPEVAMGALASQNLLPMTGVEPVLGRNFAPDEMEAGHDDVALIGFRFWQQSLGGDPLVLGRSLRVNGGSARIIGVLPLRREFPFSADLILPVSKLGAFDLTNRKHHQVEVIGRLKTGASLNEARSEINFIAARLQKTSPATNKTIGADMAPMAEAITGDLRKPLLLIMSSVGLVLLIACVNVAHLLLARSAGRQREIAIRVALGASRGRLITQFLSESMVLSFAGATAGLLLAAMAFPALRAYAESHLPGVAELRMDLSALGFTIGIAVLTGLLFGILPALRASRTDQADALRSSGVLSTQYGGSVGIRRILVIAEIALAMMVVTGAGLLLRSFAQLLAVDPGFRTDRVLTIRVPLQGARWQTYDKIQGFYARLIPALRALPSVEDVSAIDTLPFRSGIATRFAVKGDPLPEPGQFPTAQGRSIAPNFPHVMGVPVRAGRAFTEADATVTAPPRCLVNAAFAKRFLPGGAVGRSVVLGVLDPQPVTLEIVGVIGDMRGADLALEADPTIYFPAFAAQASVVISTATDPAGLLPAVRRVVASIDPEQPVAEMETMSQIMDESLLRRRFAAVLVGSFSLLALLLAAVGLYAVVSYSVAQRTPEFGLRMALGASRYELFSLVLGESVRINSMGLALGLVGSLFTSRLLGSVLFHVGTADPVTLASTSALLFLVGVLGAVLPGLRAASIDPMRAIRHD